MTTTQTKAPTVTPGATFRVGVLGSATVVAVGEWEYLHGAWCATLDMATPDGATFSWFVDADDLARCAA